MSSNLDMNPRRFMPVSLTAITLALTIAVASLLMPATALAQTKTILVIAPHPDDEALCCSGIIYSALQKGYNVKVVIVTNGDEYSPGVPLGYTREAETIAAMATLGVSSQNVIFLGYGDQTLQELYRSSSPSTVFTSDAGQVQTYANQGLGNVSYHQYLFGSPGPYNRQTILQDMQAVLQNFQPTDVYTTGLWDDHPDHQGTFNFVVEALLTLKRQGVALTTKVHETVIHPPCSACGVPTSSTYVWPQPVFTPAQPFSQPFYLNSMTAYLWNQIESIPVPAPMQDPNITTNLKAQAIAKYVSQGVGNPNLFLWGFIKKNEFFWVRDFTSNIAGLATVTASSQSPASGQVAASAVDGFAQGYPGYAPWEWASAGELAGAWIKLNWAQPMTVSAVVLWNRQDSQDDVLTGTLSFSDGSTVPFGQLPISGNPFLVTFAPKTVTSMQVTVNNAVGTAIGLTEIEVFGEKSGTLVNDPYIFQGPFPSAAIQNDQFGQPSTPVITDAQTTQLTVTALDVDGQPLTYTWTPDDGTITGTGKSITFNPPVVSASTVIGTQVSITDGQGGSTQSTAYVTVTPSNSSGISVASLNLNPLSVASGSSVVATVTLNTVAPRGAVVAITNSNPSVATMPATVFIPPGANSATFTIKTIYVTSTTMVNLSASLSNITQNAVLTVLQPSAVVSSITTNPTTIGGGNAATGTVTLSGPAPAGGAVITLTNTQPGILSAPATMTIPAGVVSATFPITTTAVTSATPGTLTATYVGQSSSCTFRVAPYVAPNLATSATVSVSSETPGYGQLGIKAIDGIVDGSPGDVTKEWATNGQLAGAWITLTWAVPVTATQVTLYDRPNLNDNVTSGTLSFSDGSTVPVGALPSNGSPLTVSFTSRTFTSMTFTVNTAVGQNIGLAEIAVVGTITPASAITGLSLNPTTVTSGNQATATVTLNGAAPTGGTVVTLSSSNSSIASVPPTVTVPAGTITTTFPVTGNTVSVPAAFTISATYNGTQNANGVVVPVGYPAVTVSSLTVSPATIGGSNSATATVTLNAGALPGGAIVTLSSGAPSIASMAPTVTIPAGQTSATIPVTTQSVTSASSVTLSASYGGPAATAQLRVAPYVAPNLATIATITDSSENAAYQQLGIKAIDGIVDGSSGDYTKEWASNGQLAGAWLRLTWSVPVTANQVILYDRPNLSDNVTSATLSFSDGSTVPVGTLPNNGSPFTVSFASRSVTWMQFTVNTAVGQNIGLAEIAVIGSVTPASAISSVTVNPSTVTAGTPSTGTVTLNGAAPSGGTLVTLSSNNPAVTVQPSVTVPAGSVTATFPITTNPVSSPASVTLSASYNGTQTSLLVVNPVTLSSITLAPTMVTGGAGTATGTVVLNTAAPAGGAVVTLASTNSSVAAVPASVPVAGGSTTATFTVTTTAVTSASQITISGTYNVTLGTRLVVVPSLSGSGMQPFAADNFNRPNGPLGSNWATVLDGDNAASVGNQQAQSSLGGRAEGMYYGGINWPADQYAQAQITGLGNGSIGPAVRMTSNGTFYAGTVGSFGTGTANVYIILDNQGGRSLIGQSTTATVLVNDVLQIAAQGTTITLTNVTRSTILLTVTDSTVTAGYPGFYIGGAGTTLTNWSAGLVTSPLPLTTTAADNFNRANAPNLGSNWTVGPGLYPIQIVNHQIESGGQGQAPGQGHGKEFYTGVSFAGDQWSMAQVIATTQDINGALVRYQGTRDTHYVGFVSSLGGPGACSVVIDRDINGQPALLVSDSTYCSFSAGDYLLMQAQGPLLSVIDYTTGALLLTIVDTQITGGSPGWSLNPIGGTPMAANWSGGKFGQ